MNKKEKNADMIVFDIVCQLSSDENIDLRYNVKTEEIEYDKEFADEWKVVTDVFLTGISNFLLLDGYVFSVDDLRRLLKSATSIKYDPQVQ
jgi:hypothetical protein